MLVVQALSALCGFSPSLADMQSGGIDWLAEALPAVHAGDAMFGSEASPWAGVYDVQRLVTQFGWVLDGFARDVGMLVMVGTWLRVVGMLCLVGAHRHMQR